MLHDYLRACWRGVLHNKVATFINVGGLALGLAVFFALILYVQREFSWDAQWEGADRIYRVSGRQESSTGNTAAFFTSAPYVLGTSLLTRHPDAFESYVRIYANNVTVVSGEVEFPNSFLSLAEPALLNLVQLETLEGSLQEVFDDPRAIALSSRAAERYFASGSALDSTLTLKSQQSGLQDYVVRAVFKVPEPSVLGNLQVLGRLDTNVLPQPNTGLDIWNTPNIQMTDTAAPPPGPLNVTHYFKLRPGLDPAPIEADLRRLMDENKYVEFGPNKMRFIFRPLQDLHLKSENPFDTTDSIQRLWMYAAIGILVLLISGCNFVMLATLRSVDRMREIGIRKTIGGEARQLLGQYLLDAFCHTLLAAGLAVLILEFSLPRMQVMLEIPLQIDLWTWRSMGLCLALVAGFTLISAAYPALLMSRGRPSALLHNSSGAVLASGNGLRRILVGIQFAIVIILLLASAVVQQQISFTLNRDRGFSVENIVALRLNSLELMQKSNTLVTEFGRLEGVQSAAIGGVSPGTVMIGQPPQLRRLEPDGSVIEAPIQQASVGTAYFSTLSVPLLAGREFTAELDGLAPTAPGTAPPAVRNVMLNRSAAQDLGFSTPEQALGELLETEFTNAQGEKTLQSLRVIGVVADTQFSSVMLPPVPQLYNFSAMNGFVAVKLEPDADAAAVRTAMAEVWASIMGAETFAPLAPELMSGNMLQREQFEARIIIGSTLLAMVIALLGLYGLVAATVVRREKEIGVRKVMGAERSAIVSLLLWQFSKPVLLANLLAWPIGIWAVMQWLERFPYQLSPQLILWSGLSASLCALQIAWLTVGFMAFRAASAKPVHALRNE